MPNIAHRSRPQQSTAGRARTLRSTAVRRATSHRTSHWSHQPQGRLQTTCDPQFHALTPAPPSPPPLPPTCVGSRTPTHAHLADGLEVHEVAVAAAVARVLLVLPASPHGSTGAVGGGGGFCPVRDSQIARAYMICGEVKQIGWVLVEKNKISDRRCPSRQSDVRVRPKSHQTNDKLDTAHQLTPLACTLPP